MQHLSPDTQRTAVRPAPDRSLRSFAVHSTWGWMRQRALLWLAVPAMALVSFIAASTGSPPSIPPVVLSSEPLYAATSGDKPTLALALSVEYPTVGAQYVDVPQSTTDSSYANTKEYLGYYDAEACYSYNDAPAETVPSGMTTSDYKRFDRSGPAIPLAVAEPTTPYKTSRKCTDAFSGNFLNWASSSAVDMLRLALSGGDRYIDSTNLTVLQRAVIPNGDPICMWNSSNFPAKQLQRNGGGANQFWGAVPVAMVSAAGSNDIWVANTLNRIYFGTSAQGGCGSTGNYNLTGASTSSTIGPIEAKNQKLPSDASAACAAENGTCSFSNTLEVWYGANKSWNVAPASNGVSCSNGVFGDPLTGTVKACYTRPYSGTWTPGGTGGLNTDGFFYSRVQVCNVNTSGVLQDARDYEFCKLYPSGKFKPGGAIQKYSDQLRLAAFGYVMDQTASYSTGGRYGGVLRAPMKYVGSKTFDEVGVDNTPTGGNPNVEWDPLTGVFKTNPDGDTTQSPQISGVINYLNKFGRTGPVPGRYKIYDPVGELHYEALRYLQGLQPSADAISSLNTTMYDGYPLFTSWTDPYGGTRTQTSQYACVRSNIVVIGDINTHDGNRLPTPSAASNIPDINYWRGIVQNFEQNGGASYVDGQGITQVTGNPNGANGGVPYSSQGSQIMGQAYWAHTHDIRGSAWTETAKQRPGLRIKTFTFDVNEYAAQNVASVRRYQNQLFMAAKYGGFESDPANVGGKPFNTKGNPFQKEDGTNNNDVWQHPDDPGEAGSYYLQSSARGVLSAFDNIFSRASSSARSIAGSAITSKNLTLTVGNIIYQGAFDTSDWSGDLLAVPVSVSSGNVAIGDTLWSAAGLLTSRASPATTRTIVVGNAGATANPVAVPFTWATISAGLQTALNKSTPAASADGLGQSRLNFIRGDKSLEGTTFRLRNKLLGDVVNSGVVFSGKPALNQNAPGYSAFAAANAARAPAVFVGANDGMLHAFNADSGQELFGYIPSWVAPNLPALTSKTYAANHRSFVDAPPAVNEADVSATSSPLWKTVLVSGTGGGGKGVFALDVTTPDSFSTSNVMWEFTDSDDVDMGFVIGRPQILRMRTSAANSSSPTYKWFAVVASGVNNYVAASTGNFSTTGSPALFLLDLSKPAGTAWTINSNYYKISLPVDSALSATKAVGAINFAAELGTSNEVVRIYMGDLHGSLWRLEFKNVGVSNWNMATLSAFSTSYDSSTHASTGTPLALFIAKDSLGNVQPISMPPSIVFSGTNNVNYVAVGTGKYLEVADKSTSGQQSFYAIYDDIKGFEQLRDTASASTSIVSSRSRLKPGTVDSNASVRTVSVSNFKWGRRTDASVAASNNIYSGWYFDFPVTGERDVSNATLNGRSITVSTLFPASTSTNVCGGEGGGGNEYNVNIDTGNGKYTPSSVGLLGDTLIVQTALVDNNVDLDSKTSARDSTGRRIRTITTTSIQAGAKGFGSSVTSKKDTQVVAGRLSWRRINNYQDLKN